MAIADLYSSSYLQQQANNYGLSVEQYTKLLENLSGSYGGVKYAQPQQGRTSDLDITLNNLLALKNAGINTGGPGAATPAAGTPGAPAAAGQSYYSPAQVSAGTGGATGGVANMANSTYSPGGASSNLVMPNGVALTPAQTQQVMGLYAQYEGGNQQAGQALVQWTQGMGVSTSDLNTAVSNLRTGSGPNAPAQAPAPDPNAPQPESVALRQMGQIDPASEVLRQAVAGSYLTPLQQAAAPSAQQFQSYLDLYKQVDPTGAAARQRLGQDLARQEALGTQLDPATQREVEQATRTAQAARGNVYGTPQLVEEAMTRGQAGLALQQQRQQALQSYLTSGQTPGDVAMNLYNQQQGQLRAAQGAALSYLGSGQTPYQAGASYLNTAEQRAAAAAQGGPQYNPAALGQQYTGAGTPSFPQYGVDMSQLAGNWYNNINAANLQAYGLTPQGQSSGQKLGKAGAGALTGAASGALAGSAVPGIGTVLGGAIGAIGGGLGGYFG